MSKLHNTTVGEVTNNLNNKRVPLSSRQRERLDKIYPYYGAQGIVDYVDEFLFDGEYLLVAEDGENLRSQKVNVCNLVNGKFWVNNHAHILEGKNGNLTSYLAYYLNLIDFKRFVSGSAQPKLTKEALKSIVINIHDIKEQKKIVKVLTDIDDKIRLNSKVNTELESMAKLIYDYWFVQFDFPDENGKPYKSSGGKMVYNEELKREIPYGWKSYKVGEIFKTDLGGTPSTKNKNYWVGNFNWLNSGEIAQFPILKSELTVSEEGIKNSAATLLPKGTCVLSITRHLRASILGVESCVNQSVVGIYETNYIKSSFIYPYLKNELPRLMSLRTGAQQPHINKGIVDESQIVIPPNYVLKSYNLLVNSSYDAIINNAQENMLLEKLRDWLLPMLMNGQVKIKD